MIGTGASELTSNLSVIADDVGGGDTRITIFELIRLYHKAMPGLSAVDNKLRRSRH